MEQNKQYYTVCFIVLLSKFLNIQELHLRGLRALHAEVSCSVATGGASGVWSPMQNGFIVTKR